jgi:hypothetical protein
MTEPAAGWYHDPADAGAWRWWDGASWTDHVRPMAEAAVAADPVPAPAPGPAQVGPQTIPQPGQVAPAPPSAAATGSVPMTPTTPVSDQLYWHSSAAEVVEVPRVHHSASRVGPTSAVHAPSYVRDWNDLGSPHTAGIWLLAFSPVLGVGVSLAVSIAMGFAGLTGVMPAIAGAVAALLLTWAFAATDARALAERGYHRPRLAWMLLFPPLAYLIARGKEVRRESKSAWAPELVFILNFLIVAAVAALGATLFAAVAMSLLPTAA